MPEGQKHWAKYRLSRLKIPMFSRLRIHKPFKPFPPFWSRKWMRTAKLDQYLFKVQETSTRRMNKVWRNWMHKLNKQEGYLSSQGSSQQSNTIDDTAVKRNLATLCPAPQPTFVHKFGRNKRLSLFHTMPFTAFLFGGFTHQINFSRFWLHHKSHYMSPWTLRIVKLSAWLSSES